jgi:predicted RNA-binding protein with TRAM domain
MHELGCWLLRNHHWSEWERETIEEIVVDEKEKFPHEENGKRYIPTLYKYYRYYEKSKSCSRCGRDVIITKNLFEEKKTIDGVTLESKFHGDEISARKVHDSEELLKLVEIPEESDIALPPDDYDSDNVDNEISRSRKAHKQAKSRSVPVEIGEVITAGIEDISKHHSGTSNPIVRYEGFVIIVKNSPRDLSIGDIITVKVTSMNKGDSVNAIFVSQED